MKDWSEVRNLLCVRLDAFGDVLMTEPALRALHQTRPDCRLTLLTSPTGAKAAAMMPYLDDVLIYEAPWMKHSDETDSASHLGFIEDLRRMKFDGAVVFTVYSQNPLPSAMLCYLAGIPRRIAFCRENPYQLLSHWLPEREPNNCQRHEVERQLSLVAETGASVDADAMQISIPQAARDAADSLWQKLAQAGEFRIAVHPGATAASRRYPPHGFIAAMNLIHLRIGAVFVLTGSSSEQALCDGMAAGSAAPVHSLAGRLAADEWAALVEAADLLVSNNTAAVHIAAATGTPIVDIYALTNPQHTPWRVRSRVLSYDVPCKYCYKSICPEGHHQCLLGVTPEQVAHAALELLNVEFQHQPPSGARIPYPIAG